MILECEFCGTEYSAERISAKYCSNSCKTMACRARRAEEEVESIRKDRERLKIEQFERNMKAMKADLELINAEQEARRKQQQHEYQENEQKRKIENEKAREAERIQKAKLQKKKNQEAETKQKLNTLLGYGIAGIVGFVSELLSEQQQKPDEKTGG